MKLFKVIFIIIGAVGITALGLDATDTLRGNSGTLLGQLITSTDTAAVCPNGMLEVEQALTFTCVDQFEVSPSPQCPVSNTNNSLSSRQNITDQNCQAVSVAEATPWRFVSRSEAQQLCARAGKRLPTALEWYQIALDTPDSASLCNVSSGAAKGTGTNESCQAASGVYDAVGNVWEWVSDDVFEGTFNNRPVPDEGYVEQVDQAGVATKTKLDVEDSLGEDYFYSKERGVFGIVRGGFFASREDAGVFATHAAMDPNLQTEAIGFRCVK